MDPVSSNSRKPAGTGLRCIRFSQGPEAKSRHAGRPPHAPQSAPGRFRAPAGRNRRRSRPFFRRPEKRHLPRAYPRSSSQQTFTYHHTKEPWGFPSPVDFLDFLFSCQFTPLTLPRRPGERTPRRGDGGLDLW